MRAAAAPYSLPTGWARDPPCSVLLGIWHCGQFKDILKSSVDKMWFPCMFVFKVPWRIPLGISWSTSAEHSSCSINVYEWIVSATSDRVAAVCQTLYSKKILTLLFQCNSTHGREALEFSRKWNWLCSCDFNYPSSFTLAGWPLKKHLNSLGLFPHL